MTKPKKRRATGQLVVIAATCGLLQACGGTDEAAAPDSAEVEVVVEIVDALPLDLYFNLDDEICTASEFMQGRDLPQITVANGEGTILSAIEGPEQGGTFSEASGCSVEIPIGSVKRSDVYTVKVTGRDGFEVEKSVNDDGTGRIAVQIPA